MELNRCKRCGCFFIKQSDICDFCEQKDSLELAKLKNYLNDNCTPSSIEELSSNTGISINNLNRLFEKDPLNTIFKNNPNIIL